MTTEMLDALFTADAFGPFEPSAGTFGLVPILEAHTATAVLVFMLALNDFNDWDKRVTYLCGLGYRCAQDGHTVTACRFGSEAWVRRFTPAEAAVRGNRQVESYPDRQEVIMVMGQTVAGDTRMAHAPLSRRADGKVERVGTWEIQVDSKMRSPLLEAFWRGYRLASASTKE